MPATPASPQYLMAERLVPENTLAEAMERLFAVSGSWEQVSRDLYAEVGVVVSGQTLRRWARQLGIEPETKAAS